MGMLVIDLKDGSQMFISFTWLKIEGNKLTAIFSIDGISRGAFWGGESKSDTPTYTLQEGESYMVCGPGGAPHVSSGGYQEEEV